MGKNVAVFVDVANIFYAAKAAGVDIDYVTLLKSATAGRDFVRAYAYTGLDPENENQRNFHSFLARHGYKVVSKDIRKYGDGKVKANLDIELVVDMMKTARNLDVAVVVSGDGDFAPAIRAVQEMGVRVEVVSFRGNTSSDLIDVADLFTDITQIAKVEKGSSRSGRRVAGDEEDLSMTEVPEKQTEGTGRRRGGRGRARVTEPAPVAAGPAVAPVAPRGRPSRGGVPIVALPGERLSKVGPAAPTPAEAELVETPEPEVAGGAALGEAALGEPAEPVGEEAAGRRRRRRRGGRGRGRGRGAEGAAVEIREEEGIEIEAPAPPRRPRPTPFGSVWDTQIGMPNAPTSGATARVEDEEFEEPEIPEYLIAERNRARAGRGPVGRGGPRGGRSAYAAAVDRERYGGGRSGGINRYPDVSGRQPGPRPEPARRPERPERAGPRSSAEPWSEVPPELEELLRAQLAAKVGRPGGAEETGGTERVVGPAASQAGPVRPDGRARGARRGGRRPTRGEAPATPPVEAAIEPTPAAGPRRGGRVRTRVTEGAPLPAPTAGPAPEAPAEAPKRRTRKAAAATETAPTGSHPGPAPEAAAEGPKRRTRKAAAATETAPTGSHPGPAPEAAAAAPRRRTRRTAVDTPG